MSIFNHYHSLRIFSRQQIGDIFLIFPINRIWHFMLIVYIGNNLHEMSNPVSWEKYEKYFNLSSAEC